MLPFFGNETAWQVLQQMVAGGRLTQTILLHGPPGIGKATMVRRFAALLLGDEAKIEQDDLSLPANTDLIAEREKLPSDKRNDDPLRFNTHPDFVTFPPDGPLRQISIEQIRLLKELALLSPLKGSRRLFLIDQVDRANEQAANSLLKILEEPPAHLVVVMTAENVFDLLPTIRSRSVMLALTRLDEAAMKEFARSRGLEQADRRIALANGCPGRAVTYDLAAYDKRRAAMLTLLQTGAKTNDFGAWAKTCESVAGNKSDKLDQLLEAAHLLLEDVLLLQHGLPEIRNIDLRRELQTLAERTSFEWVRRAVARVDELQGQVRRNIQKGPALDALMLELRTHA